jgi:succinyl-diaminopimelate desuccinylase
VKKDINVISLTQKLISFITINPPGQERACADYLGGILESGGFKVSSHDFEKGRTSLVARKNGAGDQLPICLTGHMDTMPLGKEKWMYDPFGGEIDGDKLYGRGSSDMKGGIAAMVIAARNVARYPDMKAGITLILTSGEETGCRGAYHLAENFHVIGEAGSMIIGEPTSNLPYIAHKGALWLDAITTGVSAHGSMPEQGVNAIYKAARAIEKLEEFDFDVHPHPLLGDPTLNVGKIRGGESHNSVPDRTEFGIDIRSIPGQSHKSIREKLQSYLGEEVELKGVLDVEGISTDQTHEWIQQVFRILEKYLEETPRGDGISYFTDGSVLTPAMGNPPTVILGPGTPETAHKIDEFCIISNLENATEAYIEIIRKWCDV